MIDLKEVITKYPECLGSAVKFRSYMLDLYPDPADQARIKVLADVLSCGVVDEIKKGKSDPISLSRYRKVVEEKYGYSPRLIEESIIRWTNAFEVKPAEQPAKKAPAMPAELDIGETIHVHKFKDTVVDPTCRDRGYTLHQCACGYEHKDSFTPVGQHRFEQVDEIKPTCFEEGRQDFLCSVCAEYKSEPIPKIPHKYGKWEIVNAATCTMGGARERHCKYCAASQQEIVPALGHKWSEWTTQSFATCTADGKEVRQCKRCKSVEENILPAIGHDFSEWVPSQSQEDMYERYCKNCGEMQLNAKDDYNTEMQINREINAIHKEIDETGKECERIMGCIKLYSDTIDDEISSYNLMLTLAIIGMLLFLTPVVLALIETILDVPLIGITILLIMFCGALIPLFFAAVIKVKHPSAEFIKTDMKKYKKLNKRCKTLKARLEMLEKEKAELEKQIDELPK